MAAMDKQVSKGRVIVVFSDFAALETANKMTKIDDK